MKDCLRLRGVRIILPLLVCSCFCSVSTFCQDSSDEGTMSRGSRAELAISVRDSAGEVITSPASVKLYSNGIPTDQSTTSHGRAFFILRGLGDFTIVVEASGYKSAQKDVSVGAAIRAEVDIYMQRNAASSESVGVPGQPLLAPKAKEALVKGLQALGENKLDDAQKYLSEAMKLAPGHPEVLYVQGMLYMKRSNWTQAQAVLQKSDQLEPNQARVLAALGMALCNEEKYAEAIPPLEKSVKLDPATSWQTEWTLAKSYYYHEEYEQALKMAQQARTGSHGAAQVELLYAQCLTAMGRYEDAAVVLRGVLKNNTNTTDAATAQRWLNGLATNGKIHQETNPSP